MPSSSIPVARDDDADEVTLALEVAQTQWTRGDHAEALRWLRKAIDGAFDAGHDERGVELSKVAAELNTAPAARPAPPVPVVVPSRTTTPVHVPSVIPPPMDAPGSAPGSAPVVLPPPPPVPRPAPGDVVVARPPAPREDAAVAVRPSDPGIMLQAVRVVAGRGPDGAVRLRLLDIHAPLGPGEHVALLVAMSPNVDLGSLFRG